MRRLLYLLGLIPLSLVGCYHDESSHDRVGGGWGEAACDTGVSFDLSGVQDRLDSHAPVTIRACFDKDCDELTLAGTEGKRTCTGGPGGPPDQLTGCRFYRDGSVTVDILRVDQQDYTDGKMHTVAISFQDSAGERIYSHAEAISFGSGSCGLTSVKLAQR